MTRLSWRCIYRSIVVVAILALFAPQAAAQAPTASFGVVEGRVTDGATGEALPGARLTIPGSAIETSTDREGLFRLTGVPAGQQTILVSYLGRRDETVEVDVIAGSTRRLDVNMGTNRFEEAVTVRPNSFAMRRRARLNQQKTASNITNVVSADQIGSFPDANAAETVQRIPGISITKDQGEGRYVNIRGTDPRLNSMMINGERIPAPDPLLRQVALDVVPSELLQAIEVSKALTPDMDADAIGGSVNLVMKTAPEKFRLLGAIGGGYNQMLSSYGQNDYTLTGGRRFGAGRYGVIGSVTGSEIHRGNQDMEVVYTNTLGLNELNPRYYQVNRRRTGATGAIDFRPTDNSSYTVRGGVQSLHRRSREPSTRAVARRKQPHRSRTAGSHTCRADRITGHHGAHHCARVGDARLRTPVGILRPVRSIDDDDDISGIACDVRTECVGDINRPEQRPGQPDQR